MSRLASGETAWSSAGGERASVMALPAATISA
jgi:hypothetical protein